TRLRISWQDENTLKIETDAGSQTRLFHFGPGAREPVGERTLQGFSTAERYQPRDYGVPSPAGTLRVVTSNLKPGYLRKNGVPYGERANVTEYFNRTPSTYGSTYLIVTTIVEDPDYLFGPFVTSSHFRKLPDSANGWDPSPCSDASAMPQTIPVFPAEGLKFLRSLKRNNNREWFQAHKDVYEAQIKRPMEDL